MVVSKAVRWGHSSEAIHIPIDVLYRPLRESIHTWPEDGLLTLDCFTCGAMDPEVILARVRAHLQPVREQVTAVERGVVRRKAYP